MSEPTQTKAAPPPRFSLETWSLDTWTLEAWAVAASVIFIALIVAGVFPYVSW